MCYDDIIASENCLRCNGYEFEQFDLILYKMIGYHGSEWN